MAYYTDDARSRFGNGPFVIGRAAIRADLEANYVDAGALFTSAPT